ncbi:MAG TPA: hypothetical protein VG167_05890 [Verrucomicrobiae bacterium]|nr:hypothetical protein [Verrucomicrobiae bacterium]
MPNAIIGIPPAVRIAIIKVLLPEHRLAQALQHSGKQAKTNAKAYVEGRFHRGYKAVMVQVSQQKTPLNKPGARTTPILPEFRAVTLPRGNENEKLRKIEEKIVAAEFNRAKQRKRCSRISGISVLSVDSC